MPAVTGYAAPSTLADVLRQVVMALGAMADATPVQVGKHYLEDFGVGSAPKVLFVPEPKAGRIMPPIEQGMSHSVQHSCNVLIRGVESGDDIGRYDATYELAAIVGDLIATACTGRIEWGEYIGDSPTDVDAYGAQIACSFTYRRDVPHNPRRWALPSATTDTSPPVPLVPPGVPGTEPTKFNVTTTPQNGGG